MAHPAGALPDESRWCAPIRRARPSPRLRGVQTISCQTRYCRTPTSETGLASEKPSQSAPATRQYPVWGLAGFPIHPDLAFGALFGVERIHFVEGAQQRDLPHPEGPIKAVILRSGMLNSIFLS